jgi:hypothetical protein
MKKIIAVLFVAAMLCTLMTACAKRGKTEAAVNLEDLQTDMLAADDSFPEMKSVSSSSDGAEELFSYLSDYDYTKIDGYFLSYSAAGLADEVAVVRMKSSGDADSMVDSLKKHVEGRVKLYNTYQPEQATRADKALLFASGSYAVLIISDKQQNVKAAFDKAIGN